MITTYSSTITTTIVSVSNKIPTKKRNAPSATMQIPSQKKGSEYIKAPGNRFPNQKNGIKAPIKCTFDPNGEFWGWSLAVGVERNGIKQEQAGKGGFYTTSMRLYRWGLRAASIKCRL